MDPIQNQVIKKKKKKLSLPSLYDLQLVWH